MSPEERQVLVELFQRTNAAAAQPRDKDAEAFIAEEIIDPRDTRPLVVDFVHHAYRVIKAEPRSFGMRP